MSADIILIVGLPASGKTAVALWLARQRSAVVVDVGNALRDYLLQFGVRCDTRASIGPTFLRQFARSTIFKVLRSRIGEDGCTVLDGLRFAETCEQFRAFSTRVAIWSVTAAPELRRRRRMTSLSQKGWLARQIDKEWKSYGSYDAEEEKILEMADVVVENNGALDELYKSLQQRTF